MLGSITTSFISTQNPPSPSFIEMLLTDGFGGLKEMMVKQEHLLINGNAA